MYFDNWLLGIIALFLGINIFTAIKMRSASELLSTEQKAQLFKLFGSVRIYTLLLLSAVIVAFLYLSQKGQQDQKTITLVYFIALISIMLGIVWVSVRKLKQHGYPAAYIRTYFMVNLLRNLGLLAMLAYILLLGSPNF
ncbi:MAG: hypothetical protein RLZZ370_1350 [Bacteroidota bacterium]|jgi:hypothetical protein